MILAMLNHLWQSTLWLGGAGLLTLLLREVGAHTRYWLWFAASVKFIVPFAALATLGSQIAPRSTMPALGSPVILPITFAAQQVTAPFSSAGAKLSAPLETSPNVSELVLVVWTLGMLFVAVSWFARWWRLRTLVREAQALGIAAPVPVLSTRSLLEPGLVGIWRPVLLMPEGLAHHLSSEQMRSIVAHEVSHLRRRDNLTFAIHMISQVVFWFYPLTWWLGKRLIAERERACDEAVVASGHDPSVYAESILKVCHFYVQSPLPCAAGVSGAVLKHRMEAIMSGHVVRRIPAVITALLFALGVAGIAAPLAVGVLTARPASAQGVTPSSAESTASTDSEIARRRYEQSRPRTVVKFDPKDFDKYVGYYQLGPTAFFRVFRTEDHYFAQLTGQQPVEWFPESPSKFFATVVAAQISFALDAKGQVSGLVLHQNGSLQSAERVSETVATEAAAELQQRISNNKPSPGTEAALRHQIETLERGEPDYSSMGPVLAEATRVQLPQIKELFKNMGDLKSLTFSKVLPSGMDLYIATFAGGQLQCIIAPLSPDGKVTGDFYHLLP
jgi:beta-lactamase regulating signal transducer with metallopeptidase domain